MNGKLVVTFLAGLVVGAVVAFAGWHPQALAQQAPQAQKWEYTTENIQGTPGEATIGRFNRLGSEGWEYAGLAHVNDKDRSVVIFKRPMK
jgi:hypothetical protein